MNTDSLNLNKFIVDNFYSPDNNYMDIFEELESTTEQSLQQLSPPPTPIIPNIDDDDILVLDVVSNSLSLQIPNNIQYNSINQIYIDYPKEELLIFSKNDMKIYKIPSEKAKDARKVWVGANINDFAHITEIESKLLDWAFTNANLKISNKQIDAILWKTESGCFCSSKWRTFVKWIVCASLSV
jgi:hypothetical protein